MKKLILIMLLFSFASAWRTTIDSSQVKNYFRFYKFPNDQFLFVNSSDSTFDTAGVVAEKFGIRDITFPQLISFDTAYGGCYVYVRNSDQALLLSAGTTTWNPDSGAYIALEGMNTGATGDLFMAAGNTGNVDFYGLNNFKFFNGVDTLKFYYNSGDDGFIINSKRVEITGRDGVGHGIAIDSQYVLIDDTLVITDFISNDERTGFLFFDEYGNIGNGTNTPRVVLSYTYPTTSHHLNIYNATKGSRLDIQGLYGGGINLVNLEGAADDKWLQMLSRYGVLNIYSLNDDGTTRTDNILIMDMGTGDVSFGYNVDVTGNVQIANANPYLRLNDNVASGYADIIGDNGSVYISADAGNTVASTFVRFGVDGSVIGEITSTGLNLGAYDIDAATGTIDVFDADSIYGTKIGANAAVACSLKDGTTLRATGTAFWHKVGKTFRIQFPELSGNVTSGQVTRIYVATGTMPLSATSNVYKTIFVNEEGSYAVRCVCYGGSSNLIICLDPSLTGLGTVAPLTVNEFTFEYIVN